MRIEQGFITRVDRAARTVGARFDDYGAGEETIHAYVYEPVPWALGAFTRGAGGELVCVDTLAQPQLLIDEHFMQSDVAPWEGDSMWDVIGGTAADVSNLGLGVAALTNDPGADCYLRKSVDAIAIDTGFVYHVNARIQVTAVTGDIFAVAGFLGDAGGAILVLGSNISNTSAQVWFATSAQVEGLVAAANTWYDTDFVFFPGQFAASSFDGSVPAVTTQLATPATLTPALFVIDGTLGGTQQFTLRCDRFVCNAWPTNGVPPDLVVGL